ncbi:MAG: poly(R)-hydroxyalkanoic acid synthase subunit PhaE [Nitrososphaeraceae archaeon]
MDDKINKKINDNNSSYSLDTEKFLEIYKKFFDFMNMPKIGPYHAFSKDFMHEWENLSEMMSIFMKFQLSYFDYHQKMNITYSNAMNKFLKNMKFKLDSKDDFDSNRQLFIEIFEKSYTDLYGSKDFSLSYSKLLDNYMDIIKSIQKFNEKNLKLLNLPSKEVVDQIIKDIYTMKKDIHDLKKMNGVVNSEPSLN